MWEAFLEILGSFVTFAVSMLVADAIKYFLKPGTFVWGIFWRTNLQPFIWSFASGLLISAAIIFSPAHVVFIESITATDIELDNMFGVWTAAVILGGLFKEKFGKPTAVAKQEIFIKNNS